MKRSCVTGCITLALYAIFYTLIFVAVLSAFGLYGIPLAIIGAVLAYHSPNYRQWLTSQWGYRQRLATLPGLSGASPNVLSLSTIAYLSPLSVLGLVLLNQVFSNVGAMITVAIIGLVGLGLLYGWFIKGWRLPAPDQTAPLSVRAIFGDMVSSRATKTWLVVALGLPTLWCSGLWGLAAFNEPLREAGMLPTFTPTLTRTATAIPESPTRTPTITAMATDTPAIVNSSKPTRSPIPTNTLEAAMSIHLPLTAKWERWDFVVQKVDVYTSLDDGKVKPDNGLFLVFIGELENHSKQSDCWITNNWKLTNVKTNERYDFSVNAATPLKSIYHLDIPGVLFGTCVESGEKQPLFVVFDVEQDAELALTLYEGQPIELSTANYLASVPTATPTITPAPTNTPIPTDTPPPTSTSTPTDTPTPGEVDISITQSTPVSQATSIPDTPAPLSVCPNPQVQINFPAPGTRFTSRYILISGNANIANFNYYKIEYSTDPNSNNWIYLLQHDSPIENGELMELNTTTIPEGPYGLRLTVVDQTGNYPEPCIVWFDNSDSSGVIVPPPADGNTPVPSQAVCSCEGNYYNCSDFSPRSSAQACFDYCQSVGAGDVHDLDRDNDGRACE